MKPMALTKRPKLAIALLLLAVMGGLLLALLGVRGVKQELSPGPGAPVGLVTSLPIYWPDGAELTDLTASDVETPWTRKALELDYKLQPFDTLTPADDTGEPLPGLEMPDHMVNDLNKLERLAIIQPRGLNAQDNVALDDWVRGGGRLLMVLDPLLTGHYETAVFDPRHPTGAALIPPVVPRWGLSMAFDDNQPLELRVLEARHGLLPVVMSGEISIANPDAAQCELDAEGVIARCTLGKGRITLVADAALFEAHEPGEEGEYLLRSLFRDAFE